MHTEFPDDWTEPQSINLNAHPPTPNLLVLGIISKLHFTDKGKKHLGTDLPGVPGCTLDKVRTQTEVSNPIKPNIC